MHKDCFGRKTKRNFWPSKSCSVNNRAGSRAWLGKQQWSNCPAPTSHIQEGQPTGSESCEYRRSEQ
jgi:hypothetical protein